MKIQFKFFRGPVEMKIDFFNWGLVSFPTITRLIPTLLANDIVSVQPMPTPEPMGRLLYMDFRYGDNKKDFKLLRGYYGI
jgi:hypothetical protein